MLCCVFCLTFSLYLSSLYYSSSWCLCVYMCVCVCVLYYWSFLQNNKSYRQNNSNGIFILDVCGGAIYCIYSFPFPCEQWLNAKSRSAHPTSNIESVVFCLQNRHECTQFHHSQMTIRLCAMMLVWILRRHVQLPNLDWCALCHFLSRRIQWPLVTTRNRIRPISLQYVHLRKMANHTRNRCNKRQTIAHIFCYQPEWYEIVKRTLSNRTFVDNKLAIHAKCVRMHHRAPRIKFGRGVWLKKLVK